MNDMVISLSQIQFHEQFQSLHDSIFSGQEDMNNPDKRYRPFVYEQWERVLLWEGLLSLSDEVFSALKCAAENMGDDRVIVTDSETRPPHHMSVIAIWDAAVLRHLRDNTLLDHFRSHFKTFRSVIRAQAR